MYYFFIFFLRKYLSILDKNKIHGVFYLFIIIFGKKYKSFLDKNKIHDIVCRKNGMDY